MECIEYCSLHLVAAFMILYFHLNICSEIMLYYPILLKYCPIYNNVILAYRSVKIHSHNFVLQYCKKYKLTSFLLFTFFLGEK